MKLLLIAALTLISASSFAAKCEILSHKSVSLKTINALIDYNINNQILKKTVFSTYTKTPNFGLKETSYEVATGRRDIFNEEITETVASLSLYEDGASIFTTTESKDFKVIVTELVQKLIDLKCE